MPATVIYKQGFPSLSQPVETSASIGSDGLVTGSAVFLVARPLRPRLFNRGPDDIGSPISPGLFSGLTGVALQGLFIETRNLEKRNGLTYLRLGVVGALNPPIVELKRDTSPRGFSKSESIVPFIINGTPITENIIFSFDYQAETYTASTVLAKGQTFSLTVPEPRAVNTWNISGTGFISRRGESGRYDSPPLTSGRIAARPRVLTTESSEERAGIIRLTKTSNLFTSNAQEIPRYAWRGLWRRCRQAAALRDQGQRPRPQLRPVLPAARLMATMPDTPSTALLTAASASAGSASLTSAKTECRCNTAFSPSALRI
jgi:hypothetical protein